MFILKLPFTKRILSHIGRGRSEEIFNRVQPLLTPHDKILDIGSGPGLITKRLIDSGFKATAIDVYDISMVPDIETMIYDGKHLPFKNKTFDDALLITVLHHTPNPEEIIHEALRVSERVVIMEDIYEDWFQKYATFAMDSLLNFEFFGHPHTNRTDTEWKDFFNENGMELTFTGTRPYWKLFNSVVYVIQ